MEVQIVAGCLSVVGVLVAIKRWWNETPFVRFNLVVGLIHFASVTAMAFINDNNWTATVTVFNNRMVCVDNGCQTTPTIEEFGGFPIIWPIVISGLVSGAFHMAQRDDTPLMTGVNPLRWLDYAVSSASMVVAIAMLFGVTDVYVIVVCALFQCALMLYTLVMELHDLTGYSYFGPSVFFYLVGVWLPILVSAYTGFRDQPEFVTVIVWMIFGVFAAFGVVFWVFKVHKWITNPRYYEFSYMGLSLCAKTSLAWTFYGGSAAMGRSDSVGVVGLIIGGMILLGLAVTIAGVVLVHPRARSKTSSYL